MTTVAAADPCSAEDLAAEIRGREQAATPGPLRWSDKTDTELIALTAKGHGTSFVLQSACSTSRKDPQVYRGDITGIRHPDAEFIACSRQDLSRALDAIEAVLELAGRAEYGALRQEDPLPVPSWAGQVRAVIAAGLAGNRTVAGVAAAGTPGPLSPADLPAIAEALSDAVTYRSEQAAGHSHCLACAQSPGGPCEEAAADLAAAADYRQLRRRIGGSR